ncbi:hypothetical protein K523DRAFT_318589 [Schizophyllum commune Tattone D]|nr:hypothetical protein K523DRAFT_318589 [Schizophyllum commune Tattone D]
MQEPRFFEYTTQLCSSCGHKFASVRGGHSLACLARTPYEPTDDRSRERLRSGLAKLEAGLQECNAELARLQATKASIEHSITDVRALLAPVRSVPPEILREIAAYTIPLRWFDDSIGAHVWPFTQVCCTWREIAFGLGWPWARFRLPYTWEDRRLEGEPLAAAVIAYTERSGQYPLRVGAWPSYPEMSWVYMHPQSWKAIWANAERLQALDIVNAAGNPAPYPSLPALTSLAVYGDPTMNFQDEVTIPETKLVPNLRSLKLCYAGLHSSNISDWSMLHTLDVKCARLDDLHTLSMFSNLVKLCVQSGPGIPPSNPIHLPSLKRLCVGGTAVELCPFIRAPRLAYFMLDATLETPRGVTYYEERNLLVRYAFLLKVVLAPVQTLVLRNMYSYSADTLYAILLLPRRLRALYFISGGLEPRKGSRSVQWNSPPDHIHYELAQRLVLDEARPALIDLELVVFYNTRGPTKGPDLEEDAQLVQEIWQTRGPSQHSGVLRSRLRLLVPMVLTDELMRVEDYAGHSNEGKCMPGDWDTLQWIFALD